MCRGRSEGRFLQGGQLVEAFGGCTFWAKVFHDISAVFGFLK